MKKLFIICLIWFMSICLISCKKNKEDIINITEIYELKSNYTTEFYNSGITEFYIADSNLYLESYCGKKFNQLIMDEDKQIVMVEFKTNEDALYSKFYLEKYRYVYGYQVYKNILFLNIYPNYLILNNYQIIDNVWFSSNFETLINFPKDIEYYEIPKDVKNIAVGAFANTDIKEIVFNSELKQIDDQAFKKCIKLEHVKFNHGLEYIGTLIFDGCLILKTIYVPANVKYIDGNAFNYGNVFTDEVQMPDTWNTYFCSSENVCGVSKYKFFSRIYWKDEWEFDENNIPRIIYKEVSN